MHWMPSINRLRMKKLMAYGVFWSTVLMKRNIMKRTFILWTGLPLHKGVMNLPPLKADRWPTWSQMTDRGDENAFMKAFSSPLLVILPSCRSCQSCQSCLYYRSPTWRSCRWPTRPAWPTWRQNWIGVNAFMKAFSSLKINFAFMLVNNIFAFTVIVWPLKWEADRLADRT